MIKHTAYRTSQAGAVRLSGYLELAVLVQQEAAARSFDHIVKDTGYQDYLMDGTDEGQERWKNVAELRQRRLSTGIRG